MKAKATAKSAESKDVVPLTVYVDDAAVDGLEGQTVAGVMIASGLWAFRIEAADGKPRGAYCGMGICFECEVEVDGQARVRACMTRVQHGMRVLTGSAGTQLAKGRGS